MRERLIASMYDFMGACWRGGMKERGCKGEEVTSSFVYDFAFLYLHLTYVWEGFFFE